jgi:nitroreductase
MNIHEAIAGRRSVRAYTEQPVDEAVIHGLIDAATLAPSAMNQQPYLFTVVRDPSMLERISAAAKSFMLPTIGTSPHEVPLRAMLGDPHYQIFYHAPALILISGVSAGDWVLEDCALAAENLMLAAYAAGLGTCWIGFAQKYLNTAEGKKTIGLSPECVPVAPIIVGHPAAAAPPVPRNPAAVRWVG